MAAAATSGVGSASRATEEPVPSYPEYISWAQEKLGVRVHSNIVVEDMPAPYYRGVVARSRIPAGKPLVSVPLGSLLSIQTMDGHPIESIMEKYEELDLREDDMLALMLLFEKHLAGPDSRWSKHVSLLPKSFDTVHFFTDDEMAQLQGTSNLHKLAMQVQQQVRQDYARIFTLLFDHYAHLGFTAETFSLEEYTWAIACIWSRFVSITVPMHDGQERSMKVMAPLFDMFNHDPEARMVHKYDPAVGCLVITCNQAYAPGTQVNLNYGQLPNERLLMLHGFAVPNNPFDFVSILVVMAKEAAEYEAKGALLKTAGLSPSVNKCHLVSTGLSPDLLTVLRITRATPEEMPAAVAATQGNIVSIANERRVLRELEQGLVGMLAALGADAPVEEQEQALAAILKHQTDTAQAAEAAVVAAAARAARAGKKGSKGGKKGKKGGKGGSGSGASATKPAPAPAADAPAELEAAADADTEKESTPTAGEEGEEDDVVVDVAALLAEAVKGGTDVDTDALEGALRAQHGDVRLSRMTAIAVLKCSERFILRNQLFFVRDTKEKLEAWAASQGYAPETEEERAAAEHALVAAPEGEEAGEGGEGGDDAEEEKEAPTAEDGAPAAPAEESATE